MTLLVGDTLHVAKHILKKNVNALSAYCVRYTTPSNILMYLKAITNLTYC